ncbi:PD-(D/E)XK nuclease family protein [Streptomyces sp. NPDC090032]|uniref:PD-(D/E)XK nuclease family protein n=1 Tax=Streptomyces sp. NPDC090032 TaxID=3365925 RepID=UPI0037FC07DA
MWQKPPGVNGDSALVRVGLPALRPDEGACPQRRSLKSRPLVGSSGDGWRPSPVEDFWFAPAEHLIDAAEFPGERRRRRGSAVVAPAHEEWGRQAARIFLGARERFLKEQEVLGSSRAIPVLDRWVASRSVDDVPGVHTYELEVWGRQYATSDGSIRELWIPHLSQLKPTRPLSELAAAAGVLVYGRPCDTSSYKAARVPIEPAASVPERVRIIGFGLGDGQVRVLAAEEDGRQADWTAQEARDLFNRHAAPLITPATSGSERRPGDGCVDCKVLPVCPELPRTRGLLSVVDPAPGRRKRRTVSVSDLRAFKECPARYHLTRTLNLRERAPEPEWIRRGRAVDAWLNERHADADRLPCRHAPLPETLPGLTAGELAPALAMLRQHRSRCPFDRLDPRDRCLPQQRITVYDDEADVVVIADCDLLYTERGAAVIRETKTTSHCYGTGQEVMERHPQLALAVLFLATGTVPGDPHRSRVELEVLRPDGSAEEELDPFDPATLTQARAVVRTLVDPWIRAVTYPEAPRDGYDCGQCEAHKWCATGQDRMKGRRGEERP